MKKFAKMSLVAALAVAGTAASAQPLAEAIKNVDVSGTVVYRYDDRNYDKALPTNLAGTTSSDKDSSANNYKIGLTAKSKVNDDVTAVTRFVIGSGNAAAGFATLDTTTTGDANPTVTLNNVYFSYTGIANTTVNVGKQGLTTPWTVATDSDGNEQTGTGILALTNVGPVTLAGAYFNQTNLNVSGVSLSNGENFTSSTPIVTAPGNRLVQTTDVLQGDSNVITVGAMANIGPVALDAWYLDMQDSFDTFTLGAAGNLDLGDIKLSMDARHTSIDVDKELNALLAKDDHSLTKIDLGAQMGIFGASVGYGWTDDQGGLAALDADARTGYQGWTMNLNGVAAASLLKLNANAQVLPSLNLALNYNVLDMDKEKGVRANDRKNTELYLQATYNMSKNFGGYIRFGQADLEDASVNGKDVDRTIGRLQVQYTF